MTLKVERISAQKRVYDYLRDLCRPGKLPTKKQLRHEIYYLLKHYSGPYDLIVRPDACHGDQDHKLFVKLWNRVMKDDTAIILMDKSSVKRKTK